MELFLPENILNIIERLENNGFEAYAVGGCVRDLIMGRAPKDYDVCTSALPEQTEACFSDHKVIETGIKHGTVTVVSGGENVEVTAFRTDGEYSDRRRPDSVDFSANIGDDLARRDLTINAMAYSPKRGLVDIFGGREDISRGVIKCVGDPRKRFGEDALRIMRTLRFASELGFEIEENTASALREMKELLKEVSAERLSRELVLLLCGKPFRVLTEYADVMVVIVPEIKPCIGFDQHSRYHVYDVWTHIAAATERSAQDPNVRLALFLHDIGKPRCFSVDDKGNGHFFDHPRISAEMAEEILRRLKFPNDTVSRVSRLVKFHYAVPEDSDRAVRRLLSKFGEADFSLLAEVMKGDNRAKNELCEERVRGIERVRLRAEKIIAERQCVKLSDLAVNGNDMMALGLRGKAVGETLDRLLNAVIEETVPNEKSALIRLAEDDIIQPK